MNCTACQTPIPPSGKFCPKCGRPAPPGAFPSHHGVIAHPPTAPIPKAGKVFFGLLVAGVILAILGYSAGAAWIGIAGTAVVALLVLVLLVGDALF
ncbi:MAG TPA: zinc ribbon domain-containing protein [Tepidisphaeraceae bacterium]|nr:zinc ribbon domain-containing protein [Tepidisphaeraceae bacterium]